MSKARAIVTARFELVASSAAALEEMLRDMTKQVSCTVLEVSTHAEPDLQQYAGTEPEGRRGTEPETAGYAAEPLGIEDRAEPLGRGSDDRKTGTVLRKKTGHLAQPLTRGRARK